MTTKLAKHTPGPWVHDDGEISHEGCVVAQVMGADDFPCCDEDIDAECAANARLIAAAPALLEALEACLGVLDMECPTCDGCTADPCSQCLGKAAIRAAVGAQEENTQ